MTPHFRNPDSADDPTWEAIARFHAGECGPDEAEQVRQHLKQQPGDAALLDLLAEQEPIQQQANIDTEAALVSVRRRLIAMDAPAKPTLTVIREGNASGRRTSMRFVTMAVAAVLILAFGISRWNARNSVVDVANSAAQTFATTTGQQDSLTLADGSRVVLGPNSRIVVGSDFNKSHRTVDLEGVAFFTVSHTGTAPFIVRTSSVSVRDIGTAFVVRTDSAGRVVVAVTQGQVRLARTGGRDSVDLVAGDRVSVNTDSISTVNRAVGTEDDIAWTTGRLVYRDAPIGDVLADLHRWYGVEVHVDSALTARTLRADFRTDSLAQALRIISLALGAEVEKQGNQLLLRPGNSR